VPSPPDPPVDVAEVPVRRPYDLDGDVRARIELARDLLGDAGATAPAAVEGGVFVIIAEHAGHFFDASVKLAHDALKAYFHGRFSKRPEAITVFVFPTRKAYETQCGKRFNGTPTGEKCHTALGFYLKETREVFVNLEPGLPTLTHELVHPIVETDFPHAPAWLNEGLGALYEKPVFPSAFEIRGVKNWRLPALRTALGSKSTHDAARLDALFAMSDGAFRAGDEDLHYAVARYACQWLEERGQLWAFYHAWRDGFADDPTGEKAFERAAGETPGDAQAEWEAWVRRL
jgi:hypothetical protein